MNYRRVGKHGIKGSEISIGGWPTYGNKVDAGATAKIIHAAIDSGINFIDIADIYTKGEAETLIGQAIKDKTRSDLVLSSKVFWPMSDNVNDCGLGRKHIMESVEKSLQRIGTDYLDFYFCHRFDPEVEIEETVCAMSDLVTQGKILYWGTSVWEAEQIERGVPKLTNEVQHLYKVLLWERDTSNWTLKSGVRYPDYSPREPRSGKLLQLWIASRRQSLES